MKDIKVKSIRYLEQTYGNNIFPGDTVYVFLNEVGVDGFPVRLYGKIEKIKDNGDLVLLTENNRMDISNTSYSNIDLVYLTSKVR